MYQIIKTLISSCKNFENKVISNKLFMVLYKTTIVILSLLIVLSFLSYFGIFTRTHVISNFQHEIGYCYQNRMFLDKPLHRDFSGVMIYLKMRIMNFFVISDSMRNNRASKLILYEDGIPLGPAHSLHQNIREIGEGRYSHWINTIYFSTSENSNPNTNNKEYKIQYQLSIPFPIFIIMLLILTLLFARHFKHKIASTD